MWKKKIEKSNSVKNRANEQRRRLASIKLNWPGNNGSSVGPTITANNKHKINEYKVYYSVSVISINNGSEWIITSRPYSTNYTNTGPCTWAVRGLAVGGFLAWPMAVSSSVCRSRLFASPGPSLQSQTATGQRAGAPGAPGWQAAVNWAMLQGTVPSSMFTATTGSRGEEDWGWMLEAHRVVD